MVIPLFCTCLSLRAVLGSVASTTFAPAAFALESLVKDENAGKVAAQFNVGLLDELPPKAKQAYLQYLPQLQLSADYYIFDLAPMLKEPGRWDLIGEITSSSNIGSAASVSRLDREFVTPMKILALAFPPDIGGEQMQDALDKFQASMFQLSRQARRGATTGNVAGPSSKEVEEVYKTWEAGRVALNQFYAALNEGTGTARLSSIPPRGQEKTYPRSKALYTALLKEAAVCRNRGGEALAGLWGGLMVYGTVPGKRVCLSAPLSAARAPTACSHLLLCALRAYSTCLRQDGVL